MIFVTRYLGWLGSRVVTVLDQVVLYTSMLVYRTTWLDSGAEGSVFISQPRRCRVTVLALR